MEGSPSFFSAPDAPQEGSERRKFLSYNGLKSLLASLLACSDFLKPCLPTQHRLRVIVTLSLMLVPTFWISLWYAGHHLRPLIKPEPEWKYTIMTVGAMPGEGFFAHFDLVCFALEYAEMTQAVGVIVDLENEMYQDAEKGKNWWAYFFEPKMWLNDTEVKGNILVLDPNEFVYMPSWPRRMEGTLLLGESNASLLYVSVAATQHLRLQRKMAYDFISLCKNNLNHLPMLTGTTLSNSPIPLPEAASSLFRCSNNRTFRDIPGLCDRFKLGVHYRGTDNGSLMGASVVPFSVFWREIDTILTHLKQPNKTEDVCTFQTKYHTFYFGCKPLLVVASDDESFLTETLLRYGGDMVTYQPNVSRMHNSSSGIGIHKNSNIDPYLRGRSVVLDSLLLSQCNYLIKTRSFVSLGALIMNPTIPYTVISLASPFRVYIRRPPLVGEKKTLERGPGQEEREDALQFIMPLEAYPYYDRPFRFPPKK